MFNSSILDVAVGLVFVFLALSLAVSAIVEAISSSLNWRSKTLLQGMKDLLNDESFQGLAKQIYNHALVNPRGDGKAANENDLKYKPAYIDPQQFASAFTQVSGIARESTEGIKSGIKAIADRDKQLGDLLEGIFNRTSGDLEGMQKELAGWFDNAMDRISGAYKRSTQIWSFLIALVLAIGLNVSTIDIGRMLWQEPIVMKTLAPVANQTPEKALAQLQKLQNAGVPIGWSSANADALRSLQGIWTVLGWVITAFATLFGAPFWFDTLQRITHLKGVGPSPAETSS